MKEIVVTPNPVLIKTAEPVAKFDRKLHLLIKDMEQALLATVDPVGVGLAAPQVGISLRIFQIKPTEKAKVTTYINPVINKVSEEEEIPISTNSEKVEHRKPGESKGKLLEGCLSIPNIWGNVTRKKELTLTWQDENGTTITKDFSGFPAVIVQHEMDHLNGVLFTTHVMSQGEKLYKSHKNEVGEDEFDEIKL